MNGALQVALETAAMTAVLIPATRAMTRRATPARRNRGGGGERPLPPGPWTPPPADDIPGVLTVESLWAELQPGQPVPVERRPRA